jgi:O-antigen/teichoic acid export membrane protein
MKHWFRDTHFRSLLKNVSYLAASRGVAAVAGIATLAFAGRGLGVTLFGMLILISSYAQAASGLSKFQSWQLIIRYGGAALTAGDHGTFKQATGFALALDLVSGLVGMAAAMALLPILGPWFKIPAQYLWLAMVYCALLPTMGAATPIGVLRALDRFDLISWQGTADPIARAFLAGIAWWMGFSFPAYVAIWFITNLGGDLYLWFLAWRELRRRDLLQGIRPTFRPTELVGAWKFAIHVNLTSSLMTAWSSIARLLVGGLLGPASAGLYRVAAGLADSTQKPADLLAKAYFPEVMRMNLATKHPWRLMLRGIALATAFGIAAVSLVVVGGKALLAALLGPEFIPAYPVLLVMLGVPLLAMLSFPMPSMLYALDRPDAPLKARLMATIAYFAIIVPLTARFDTVGAAVAFVIGNAVMVLVLVLYLRREYRRVRAK